MMFVKNRASMLAAVSMACLSLAACGQGGAEGESKAKSNPLENIMGAAQGVDTSAKFNAYVEGYNTLISTFGVAHQYDRYQKLNIPGASASADLSFPANISLFERAFAKLKEGRAATGDKSTEAADAAAEKLIASGDALIAKSKELEPYYASKAYRDDNLAKGKAAHAELVAAYDGLLAGLKELDAALSALSRAENAKRIADLREAGEDNAANLIDAASQAELLVDKALDGKTAEADALLPALEAAIAKARESQAKMDAGDINKMHYTLTLTALTDVVGDFRNLKQSPSDSNKEALQRAYNESVTAMNRANFPG